MFLLVAAFFEVNDGASRRVQLSALGLAHPGTGLQGLLINLPGSLICQHV